MLTKHEDLDKLAAREESNRYVFFMSPLFLARSVCPV
jgi:hypothetical protein